MMPTLAPSDRPEDEDECWSNATALGDERMLETEPVTVVDCVVAVSLRIMLC